MASLKDVAKLANVSLMTVSRALRGERRVAPALVEKVREVAASLGYVPDLAARATGSPNCMQDACWNPQDPLYSRGAAHTTPSHLSLFRHEAFLPWRTRRFASG